MSYINNMNPRRMIWFNQNAPKNKMDLWLSYNRHYEDTSEDETTETEETIDNPRQRHCDLILKAWDCGKWVPIVGFNTTAANKIDTVTGTSYTPPEETNPHNGKTLYHPAVFTAESPNELFDWGSLGNMLKDEKFVTNNDWGSIYNTRIKNLVIQDIDVDPAEESVIGGIYASRFGSSHVSGLDNYPYIAKCCYKFLTVHSTNPDYNLFVHARDIISAINNYITYSPSPEQLPIPWATTTDCGGILADVHRDSPDQAREAGVLVRFVPLNTLLYDVSYNGLSIPEHHLAITGELLIKAINEEMHNHPENPGIDVGGGSTIDPLALYNSFYNSPTVLKGWSNLAQSALKPRFELAGSRRPENRGKIPMLRNDSWWNTHGSGDTNYTETDNALEWINIPNTWRSIQVNGSSISGLGGDPSGNTVNLVLRDGISIEAQTSASGITPIAIGLNIDDASQGKVLSYGASGVEWITLQPGTLYTEGDGIDITDGKISIDTSNVTQGHVLSCGASGVEWVAPQTGGLTAGIGVQISLNNKINSEIIVDNTNHSATGLVTFNCVLGDSQEPSNYIMMVLDGDSSTFKKLYPFNYAKVNLSAANNGEVRFAVSTQKVYMKGDPVFIELDLSGSAGVVTFTCNSDNNNGYYIDSNGVLTGNQFKERKVLVTILFGIIRLEAINVVS